MPKINEWKGQVRVEIKKMARFGVDFSEKNRRKTAQKYG